MQQSYAGFVKRLIAFVIDMVILNLVWDGLFWQVAHWLWFPQTDWALALFDLEGWVFAWLYQAGFEASICQATPGKLALSLKVVNAEGQSLRFSQASIRYWGQFLSLIPLCGGFVYMIWSPQRQTWHDMLAKAYVIDTQKQVAAEEIV